MRLLPLPLIALAVLACTSTVQAQETNIKTQLGEVAVEALAVGDPITARMDSNMSIRLAGPLAVKIPAHDLPIVGKRRAGGQEVWAVQFGAKNSYVVLVNAAGQIFALQQGTDDLVPDPRLSPKDARITPLPR